MWCVVVCVTSVGRSSSAMIIGSVGAGMGDDAGMISPVV